MIAAIIQARMTSTRLPGKVMLKVLDRPLLDYMVERAMYIKKLDEIILATTTNQEDNIIVEYARKKGLKYYRGSEHDVLDRYYQTAKKFGVKHIMRITSDCPLIDPLICDQVIRTYLESDIDYIHTGLTFAEGLDCELLSFNVLERAWQEAALPSEREHVTQYLHNHPELFKKVTFHNKSDDSKYRFTVDEQEDFHVVKEILESLYSTDSPAFSADEIKRFLDANPDVFQINTDVVRNQGLIKSLQDDTSE